MKEVSEKILNVLKWILGGDRHAAEWALLSLVSKVYKREAAFMLGNLSSNLSGVTSEQAELFNQFISAVVPFVCHFKSTVESLSNVCFNSKKNYDTNSMEHGLLGSVTSGTLFCIDETNMKDGKLIKNGVYNIKAVATLIEE